MSHEGKMARGEKWYGFRDIDGNLPEGIKKNKTQMEDVNYFLEQTKLKEQPKSKKEK